MKSFLRWAGSKRGALPQLTRFWAQSSGRYFEPFAGSASLFFAIGPVDAVLGDLNRELICTFRAVQRDVHRVLECLHRLPPGKRGYYSIRKIDPATLTEYEIAARFIYLNRYCFNGLFRTNKTGRFNVPYGPPRNGGGIDESLVVSAAQSLQSALLIAGDFEVTLALARRGDFVYLDPPYVTSRRRIFSEYLPGSFSAADLRRLDASLRELDSKGVDFVVTYADTPEARRLLRGWQSQRIAIRRNIAGFSGDRRVNYELLATNSGERRRA